MYIYFVQEKAKLEREEMFTMERWGCSKHLLKFTVGSEPKQLISHAVLVSDSHFKPGNAFRSPACSVEAYFWQFYFTQNRRCLHTAFLCESMFYFCKCKVFPLLFCKNKWLNRSKQPRFSPASIWEEVVRWPSGKSWGRTEGLQAVEQMSESLAEGWGNLCPPAPESAEERLCSWSCLGWAASSKWKL